MFRKLADTRASVLTGRDVAVATEGFFSDTAKYLARLGKEKKPAIADANIPLLRKTFADSRWLAAQDFPTPSTPITST